MGIKLNYRWAIFPPWYVYNAFKNSQYRTDKSRHIEYFFILWFSCQWLLIFFSHRNVLLGIITADLALLGLLTPYYFTMYLKDDQSFLEALPVKIINAITGIAFMYIFAEIAAKTLHSFEINYKIVSFSSSYMWTSYHIFIKYLLMLLFIFPISLNFNKIFKLFPKEDYKGDIINLTYKYKIMIVMTCLGMTFVYFVTRADFPYY